MIIARAMAVPTRVLVWIATWVLYALLASRVLVPYQLLVLPASLFRPLNLSGTPTWAVLGWLVYLAQAWLMLTRTTRRSFWLCWILLALLLAYNLAAFTIWALQGLR